jgi:uncharacterized protein HemX
MIAFIAILLLLAAAVGAAYYFTQKQTKPTVDSSSSSVDSNLTTEPGAQSVNDLDRLSDSISNKMSNI